MDHHDFPAHPLPSSTMRTILSMLAEEISDFIGRAETLGAEWPGATAEIGLRKRIRALAEVLTAQGLGALPAQCRELRALLSESDCAHWVKYLVHEGRRAGGDPQGRFIADPAAFPGPVRILAGFLGLIVP